MIQNPKVTVVQETDKGVWLWELPSGKYLADTDGNFLSMNGRQHDIKAMKLMREAAKSYGFEEGRPVFKPGHSKITNSEYELQLERLDQGLYPDPYDPGIEESAKDQWNMRNG